MNKTALLCLALMAAPFNRLTNAECLVPPSPCEALAKAAIVVVVDVIVAGPNTGESPSIPQAIRLRVVERFKGVSLQQQEITAKIFFHVEALILEQGKRYLVYASQNKAGDWTITCSRTKLVDGASEELSQLRQCAKR